MEDYGSCSEDSGMDEQGSENSAVTCLEQFKVRIVEFSQPNLAKGSAENEELTPSQLQQLESLSKFSHFKYITQERFISIAREASDLRSFRVLFGQQTGSLYDFSLMCVDIYFHSTATPSVVLRTGLGEASLSVNFQESGVLLPNVMGVELESYGSTYDSFLNAFLENLHSYLFIHDTHWESLAKYQDSAVPDFELQSQENFLRYALGKFAIYDMLTNTLPELCEAVMAYYIIYRPNLKLHLDINAATEGSEVTISKESWAYERNPKLMEEFEGRGYNTMQTELFNNIRKILDSLPSPKDKFGIDITNSAPVVLTEASQNDPQPPESVTSYFQSLKDFRFNTAEFYKLKNHVHMENVSTDAPVNTNRLSKEVKVLSQHLPCEATGAIFVVMDSERMDLMKALISGTEDTPYTHGLYEFHITCPPEYPKKPPIVSIVTTGKGKVRFNPNLYDDGYVCLSVINTWDGDPSERWNPAHSNILQVLLSIQVLVMDNRIIQKEPEFEHLAEDSWENKMYSNIVKYNNVKYAMIGMIDNPPEEFREAIWRHFALKRNAIMATVDKWLEEAKNFVTPTDGDIDYLVMDHNPHTSTLFKSYSYYSMLLEARNELLRKLDSVPSLGIPRDEYQSIEITEDLVKLGGYYKKMNIFMISYVELAEAGGYRHSLGSYLSSNTIYQSKAERFNKEKEQFGTLKCLPNSSIFIVSDTERSDLLKILISGPVGTDYSNGLFLFDVVCPDTYPETAPKVLLLTTGRYKVNFSPRLRSNGEVTGLVWTPESTLASLFLQIQEIFKETVQDSNSKILSAIVRYNTLAYAVLDMVKHPPADFKAAVAAHFEFKKRDVLLQVEAWLEEATSIEDFSEVQCDNMHTLQIFMECTPAAAIENMYSEIADLIGEEADQEWSESEEYTNTNTNKKKKGVMKKEENDSSSGGDSEDNESIRPIKAADEGGLVNSVKKMEEAEKNEEIDVKNDASRSDCGLTSDG